MKKYMDNSKATQAVTPQQSKPIQASAPQQPKPKLMQVSSSRQIQDIFHPRSTAAATPTHEDIAKRAYEIYTRKGCRQDLSKQNWLQAEQELQNQKSATFSW
jgi:hypothetical protein